MAMSVGSLNYGSWYICCRRHVAIASRLNGALYCRQVLAVVRESISKTKSWQGVKAEQLGALLIDAAGSYHEAGDPSAVSGNEIQVMCEAIRYINTMLGCAFRPSNKKGAKRLRRLPHIMGLTDSKNRQRSIAAQRLLEWMSTPNMHTTEEMGVLRRTLGDELVEMFRFVVTLGVGDLDTTEVQSFIDLLLGSTDRHSHSGWLLHPPPAHSCLECSSRHREKRTALCDVNGGGSGTSTQQGQRQ